MKLKRLVSVLTAVILAFSTSIGAFALNNRASESAENSNAARIRVPLNLAVLIQDDLVPRVGNELERTREFIRELPRGSRVMVGYITTGTLQVRQAFTDDLDRAANSLRIPVGSPSASSYNPYIEVREALKLFPADRRNVNAMLLVSDGLDTSRGFDFSSTVQSIDLNRASREAQLRGVAIYSFYAPSTALSAHNRTAVQFGQGALNRLSKETGGQAFFQGSDFVSFDPYFVQLSRAINQQFGGTS